MKKMFAIIICLVIVFSFVACNNNNNNVTSENKASSENNSNVTSENKTSSENTFNVTFTETDNKTIIANDNTEYTFVGFEGRVWCFGELDFVGHVEGEKKSFIHLTLEIKTGMYSVNGKQDVLVRYFPDNEFSAMYIKSDLLKTEITLDNCIRFGFVKSSLFDRKETILSKKGITECEQFLSEIKSGPKAKDAGLYDLVRQPDGVLKNCYVYGYVCGVIWEDINIVIPLQVISFDDKAYSITIDDIEYVLPKEWLDKLTSE